MSGAKKIFFLDTSVLLHDPLSIYKFEDNDVVIATTVIEELDKLKSSSKDVASDARAVIRNIDWLTSDKNSSQLVDEGVSRNDEGGLLRIPFVPLTTDHEITPEFPNKKFMNDLTPDERIIYQAIKYKEQFLGKESIKGNINSSTPVIFVSRDLNARIIAKYSGIESQDYRDARVIDKDESVGKSVYHLALSVFNPEVVRKDNGDIYYFPVDSLESLTEKTISVNQFIIDSECGSVYRVVEKEFQDSSRLGLLCLDSLESPEAFGVLPQNNEQKAAMDLLLDDDIPAVAITGKAGSGKTLLSIAAALELIVGKSNKNTFNRLIVSRSTSDLDDDIGFLPGSESEKMTPWLGGITDNLEYLVSSDDDDNEERLSKTQYVNRYIDYKSINYMRGRSIQNSIMIIDEVQNLSPHQVKTLITRMSRGSKIILLGDLSQIDNPFISAYSSGLTYLIEKMSEDGCFGHIELEGAPRSRLAERASELL